MILSPKHTLAIYSIIEHLDKATIAVLCDELQQFIIKDAATRQAIIKTLKDCINQLDLVSTSPTVAAVPTEIAAVAFEDDNEEYEKFKKWLPVQQSTATGYMHGLKRIVKLYSVGRLENLTPRVVSYILKTPSEPIVDRTKNTWLKWYIAYVKETSTPASATLSQRPRRLLKIVRIHHTNPKYRQRYTLRGFESWCKNDERLKYGKRYADGIRGLLTRYQLQRLNDISAIELQSLADEMYSDKQLSNYKDKIAYLKKFNDYLIHMYTKQNRLTI